MNLSLYVIIAVTAIMFFIGGRMSVQDNNDVEYLTEQVQYDSAAHCQEDEAWWWVANDTRGCVNTEDID